MAAAIGLALSASALTPSPSLAVVPGSTSAVNTDAQNLALHGYDAVAYFTDGAPTKGDPKFAATFEGARYQFANEANLKTFQANPAGYTPQFGGFCSMGAVFGEKVDGDPTAWKVVDGKLYLNFNKTVAKRWQEDIPGNIEKAQAKWPQIKDNAQ
jgi:YHS domain-containing protein